MQRPFPIPVIPTPYKILGVVLALVATVSFSFYKGYEYHAALDAKEQQKALAAEYKRGIESAKITERVVTEYKNRIITVNHEVVKYVERARVEISDADNFILPDSAIRLYNGSLQRVPDTTSGTDGESNSAGDSGGVQGTQEATDLRTFSEVNSYNNGICKANVEKLDLLQTWIRDQQKLYSK